MKLTYAIMFFLLVSLNALAQVPHSLVNGQPANANQINENFTFLKNKIDVSNTEITSIKTYLGIDASNNIQVSGSASASAFYYTSDAALKTEVRTLGNSLTKIKQLRGVSFLWKGHQDLNMGLIAQEVEQVYPELVKTNKQSVKSVQYGNLVAPLIESVKELANQNEVLRHQIQIQQKQLKKLLDLQIQQASLLQQLKNNSQTALVTQNPPEDSTETIQFEFTKLTTN